MRAAVSHKLHSLSADYQEVVGHPFDHFFCPVLFKDEDVELCEAHITNETFGDNPPCTIQRKDVDNFFGRVFEADFVDIRHRGTPADKVVSDPSLSRQLKPKVRVDGRVVGHYVPTGPVPAEHTVLNIEGGTVPLKLAIKMNPSETAKLASGKWELGYMKDLRLPAFVSALKAAHLTLFHVLGYRYAFSAGGYFFGKEILGKFYSSNAGLGRPEILSNAVSHFAEFQHMARPWIAVPDEVRGTAIDRNLFVCIQAEYVWALVVPVRAGGLVFSVLAPVFEGPDSGARFLRFLSGPQEQVLAHAGVFENEQFSLNPNAVTLHWPKTGVELLSPFALSRS